MDPDELLAGIMALSRRYWKRLPLDEHLRDEAGRMAHMINQLVDHIEMGGSLPRNFTRHAEVMAAAAKRAAEQAGC